MHNYKLSICIATYNRGNYISQTLNSIICQLVNSVEIVIVDGASTDNTFDIIQNYVNMYDNISYYKLDTKGGVDKDYDIAVNKSKGKMCWLFTDDDLMHENAIDSVLSYINEEVGLIIVNSTSKNKNLTKIIDNNILKNDDDIVIDKLQINKLFEIIVPYISFIGCVVIERNIWLERNREKFYGTEFVHVGVIFQRELLKKSIILSKPLITIRLQNEQWTSRSFEIWIIKWPNLLFSFDLVNQDLRQAYNSTPTIRKLRDIIIQRSKGAYTNILYLKWFHNKKIDMKWKFIFYIFSIVPIHFCKIIIQVYLFFKYNNKISFEK